MGAAAKVVSLVVLSTKYLLPWLWYQPSVSWAGTKPILSHNVWDVQIGSLGRACVFNRKHTLLLWCHFFFILLIHEGSHREVYQEFQPSYHIFPQVVARVVQTTGSVHPQPTLPNCQLCINTEPTTSIGRLIKSSRLERLAATLKQHLNSLPSKY